MYKRKQDIEGLLQKNDLDALAAFAKSDRKVISQLIRIAYDKETLAGWRAIKAIGLASRGLVSTDAEFLRETCRKLLWSLTDESGGIGWSAPEILGEIVSADPSRFPDIIPLIAGAYEVEEDVFRSGVVYALCRIAGSSPGLAAGYQKVIILSLVDPNPLVKVNGLDLVGILWPCVIRDNVWTSEYQDRIRLAVRGLLSDRGEAWIYRGDDFMSVQVSEMAGDIIKIIK